MKDVDVPELTDAEALLTTARNILFIDITRIPEENVPCSTPSVTKVPSSPRRCKGPRCGAEKDSTENFRFLCAP